jgi:hypothetical protein
MHSQEMWEEVPPDQVGGWLYELSELSPIDLTRSLKPPGFNPSAAYEVISWFQSLLSRGSTCCRYSREGERKPPIAAQITEEFLEAGLYKLESSPFDPALESAWFQPSSLSSENLVSKFAFKWVNVLYRYIESSIIDLRPVRRGGAVQVESSWAHSLKAPGFNP